jgi:hypothetical protein
VGGREDDGAEGTDMMRLGDAWRESFYGFTRVRFDCDSIQSRYMTLSFVPRINICGRGTYDFVVGLRASLLRRIGSARRATRSEHHTKYVGLLVRSLAVFPVTSHPDRLSRSAIALVFVELSGQIGSSGYKGGVGSPSCLSPPVKPHRSTN